MKGNCDNKQQSVDPLYGIYHDLALDCSISDTTVSYFTGGSDSIERTLARHTNASYDISPQWKQSLH